MTSTSLKLLLVDDHEVVRTGLRTLLSSVPHLVVVGEAVSIQEAIVEARKCQPAVILMDVRLPDGSGVEACRQIRSESPDIRVLMLTSYDDEEAVVASILAGASGYLLKRANARQLLEAVEVVARGDSLLDPAVTHGVFERIQALLQPSTNHPLAVLSEQERRILPLIAEGRTNREIAAALVLSEHTVKTYVSDILRKLHVGRRAEAAAFITRHGATHTS